MAVLTPLTDAELDAALLRLHMALMDFPEERAVLERIAASRRWRGGDAARWHRSAVDLAAAFAMRPIEGLPQESFSWDGRSVRISTEAAVLVHEVAHFQIASPARRFLPDFGLGAGPETGLVAVADAARVVADAAREAEEQLVSLLGILWEVELAQPGILAFQEQNWLEGAGRPSTATFFVTMLRRLRATGLVDDDYRPLYAVNILDEPPRNPPPPAG